MEKIIIANKEKLEEIKKAIARDGAEKLHVLSDFDRAITIVEGVPSVLAILRDGDYLTPSYARSASLLYEKYRPVEIDPNIPLEEKKRKMIEWWKIHFDLLIESGLNRNDIEKVVDSRKVKIRKGADKFLKILKKREIPLIILSASGLGEEAISAFLKKEGKLYENICIISNRFRWDERGNAIEVIEPIVHKFNKDETIVKNEPVFNKIKDRRNVLLLGDSLSDLNMINGFDYDNLLKVGFLNHDTEENLEAFKKSYDILFLNNSPMDYLNKILKKIAK